MIGYANKLEGEQLERFEGACFLVCYACMLIAGVSASGFVVDVAIITSTIIGFIVIATFVEANFITSVAGKVVVIVSIITAVIVVAHIFSVFAAFIIGLSIYLLLNLYARGLYKQKKEVN